MVHWVQPSGTTIRIVATTLIALADLLTLLRLTIRIRTGRFWLDDVWVIIASICSILLLVNVWIRTDSLQSREAKIVAYWMLSLNFTNVLWASRMSILFAVFRLIPPQMRLRQVTSFFIIFFGLMWAALLIQKVYICASDTYWYNLESPQCHLGKGVAGLELATDGVADLALALIPMHLLRDITLPMNQHIMLVVIFSSSLLITVASIVHAVFLLGPTGLLESTSAHIEAAVALMVASFGVVVTAIYRLIRKEGDTNPDYTYNFETSTDGGLRMQRVRRGAQANIATIAFTISRNEDKVYSASPGGR